MTRYERLRMGRTQRLEPNPAAVQQLVLICASERDGLAWAAQHGYRRDQVVIAHEPRRIPQVRGFRFHIVSPPTLAVWRIAAERGIHERTPAPPPAAQVLGIDHGRDDATVETFLETKSGGLRVMGAHRLNKRCGCRSCLSPVELMSLMVVCPFCGNKRCPRANDHNNQCTGSNEPGQPGSAYP